MIQMKMPLTGLQHIAQQPIEKRNKEGKLAN
jgi:hypothetical protein